METSIVLAIIRSIAMIPMHGANGLTADFKDACVITDMQMWTEFVKRSVIILSNYLL